MGVIEKCQDCDFQTHSKMNLIRHKKLVHDQVFHQCGDCEYRTAIKSDFNRHRNEVHLKLSTYQCYYCDFQSSRRNYLKKHIEKAHIACNPPCIYRSKTYKDHLRHVEANH